MPSTDVYDPEVQILNGHENRIQRVEIALAEANQSLVRVQTGLEYVSESVENGFRSLGAKMDKASDQNNSIEAKVGALQPRIELLEADHLKKRTRQDSLRKASVGLALTGAGAAVAKFGGDVATFIGHLFGG